MQCKAGVLTKAAAIQRNLWIGCFIQQFCHTSTVLPQQFGVSKWSCTDLLILGMHAARTHLSIGAARMCQPSCLSRLVFGRLPVLKECRVCWFIECHVSAVSLHTFSRNHVCQGLFTETELPLLSFTWWTVAFSIVRLNVGLRQESEMVRETSQWEREEMEKVVSEIENHLFWER